MKPSPHLADGSTTFSPIVYSHMLLSEMILLHLHLHLSLSLSLSDFMFLHRCFSQYNSSVFLSTDSARPIAFLLLCNTNLLVALACHEVRVDPMFA